jgi:thiamine biosynthesis protein ThiS
LQVSVHLHGILRDHLPSEAKGQATLSLDDRTTVGDLLAQLGIKRRVIVALNQNQEPDDTYVLQDGDKVSIYTVIGGGQ